MSTTSTYAWTPHVRYLLSTRHTVISVTNDCTVVTFPADSPEAQAEWKEHYNHVRPKTVYASTARLADSTLTPVLDVIEQSHSEGTNALYIDVCWAYITSDGYYLASSTLRHGTFRTAEEAKATFKKWTKACAEYDRDTAFIQEYQYDVQDLADMNADPAINPVPGADTKVGDVVTVWGHGRQRLGIVAEVTKTRVKVVWTTPTAVKNGADPVINWHKKQVVEAAPVDSVAGMVEAFDRQPNHVVERYLAQS